MIYDKVTINCIEQEFLNFYRLQHTFENETISVTINFRFPHIMHVALCMIFVKNFSAPHTLETTGIECCLLLYDFMF